MAFTPTLFFPSRREAIYEFVPMYIKLAPSIKGQGISALLPLFLAALNLATLGCGYSPTHTPDPTPIPLPSLTRLHLDAEYPPSILSGDKYAGTGPDGEIYLVDMATGDRRQLTDDGHMKRQVVISGDYVAWVDNRRHIELNDGSGQGFSDDIFVLDMASGEQRRLTDAPARRSNLRISGQRLVWEDNRNELEEHYTHSDIYAYDLGLDEERPITVAPGSQTNPAIHGDLVVWSDNRASPSLGKSGAGCTNCWDNRFDIYLYDFATNEEQPIAVSGFLNTEPSVYGKYVAWNAFQESGGSMIQLLDIGTGERRALTDSPVRGIGRLSVSGNYVVWRVGWACDVITPQRHQLPTGVYAYDLRTGDTLQLSNYVEAGVIADGNTVVIVEGCHFIGSVYAVFLE